MLYFSVWLTLFVAFGGRCHDPRSPEKVGAGSAKYFIRQQKAVADTEGYIQEMMNGQKVVKVFNHEKQSTRALTNQ